MAQDQRKRYDVFLSHSSIDISIVRELAERLEADGLTVWLDEWVIEPGDSIPMAIEKGIGNSQTLILCMSEGAQKSDWVAHERHSAIFRDPTNKKRRFIPLRLDDSPIPDSIRPYAYIDWRTPNLRESQYQSLKDACLRETARSRSRTVTLLPLQSFARKPPEIPKRLMTWLAVMTVLFVVIHIFCLTFGYDESLDAERYRSFLQKSNWSWLYLVAPALVAACVYTTWEPFMTGWLDEDSSVPIIRDGTGRLLSATMRQSLVDDVTKARKYAVAVAAVAAFVHTTGDLSKIVPAYISTSTFADQLKVEKVAKDPDFFSKWLHVVQESVERDSPAIPPPWHQWGVLLLCNVEQAMLLWMSYLVLA